MSKVSEAGIQYCTKTKGRNHHVIVQWHRTTNASLPNKGHALFYVGTYWSQLIRILKVLSFFMQDAAFDKTPKGGFESVEFAEASR
jgi:hypothetical protein